MRTEGLPDPRKKESEVIIDLCHGPHSGTGVSQNAPLIDGNGRREPLHRFHIGPFHLFQELSGIGGKGFHIPPLPLRIERVEGQCGFSGAAQASDHHQPIPWDLDIDIL